MAFGAALGTVIPPVSAPRRTLPGRRTRSLAASRKAYGMEHGIGKACGRLGSVGSAAAGAGPGGGPGGLLRRAPAVRAVPAPPLLSRPARAARRPAARPRAPRALCP